MAELISDVEPPAPPPAGPRARPLWSRVATGVCTVGVALLTLTQLTMTFLTNAPSNIVTNRYQQQINQWIYPWFEQNWRLFAPNPLSANLTIEARVASDCGRAVSPWYDLSAIDNATVLHNPFPGHTEQNELRRAWESYVSSHGANDEPQGSSAEMLRQYLANIALEKIKDLTPRDGLPTDQISQIEFRVTTQVIAPPATPHQPPEPVVRVVSWQQAKPNSIALVCPAGSMP